MTTPKKKPPPEVPPPDPSPPYVCEVHVETYVGDVLLQEGSRVDPVLALGDAIARFEDAMLKRKISEAAEAAFDIAWLARECKLRRGDIGNDLLRAEKATAQ